MARLRLDSNRSTLNRKPNPYSELRAQGVLQSNGPGTWTYLPLGGLIRERLASRGKVRVRGTVGGTPFESTAIPWDGSAHILLITKPIQSAAGVGPGSRVRVKFTPVLVARPVRPPAELAKALDRSPNLRRSFGRLAPSHRREYSEYVRAAKLPATRKRRAARVLRALAGRSGGSKARASSRNATY